MWLRLSTSSWTLQALVFAVRHRLHFHDHRYRAFPRVNTSVFVHWTFNFLARYLQLPTIEKLLIYLIATWNRGEYCKMYEFYYGGVILLWTCQPPLASNASWGASAGWPFAWFFGSNLWNCPSAWCESLPNTCPALNLKTHPPFIGNWIKISKSSLTGAYPQSSSSELWGWMLVMLALMSTSALKKRMESLERCMWRVRG